MYAEIRIHLEGDGVDGATKDELLKGARSLVRRLAKRDGVQVVGTLYSRNPRMPDVEPIEP
jgi:hypothetical protein